MQCERCRAEHRPADLYDGDLCRDCAEAAGVDTADPPPPPREVSAPRPAPAPRPAAVTAVAPPAASPRWRDRAELLETFEQRDERLAALPGGKVDRAGRGRKATDAPWSRMKTSIRLDKAVDNYRQNAVSDPRECPVCRRRFTGGRIDRITCPDGNHCRDLARRVRAEDPTVEAALKMLYAPPDCAGCGKPLWGMRPDARHHGAACVKRRRRAERRVMA